MKYSKLRDIRNQEDDDFELIDEEINRVNGSEFKVYWDAIIREKETDKYFCVQFYTDSGDYGITPELSEELNITEVQKVEVKSFRWKPVK